MSSEKKYGDKEIDGFLKEKLDPEDLKQAAGGEEGRRYAFFGWTCSKCSKRFDNEREYKEHIIKFSHMER